ncbi:MAG: queuosine precursor transporter [Spirochaetes bacterium]|nr:queuosine precursor transporter [Spirochaetota bacterium]
MTLRYFPLISSLFVTTLIVSNIVAVKMVNFWGFYVPAAMVLFPLAYIFGDILTEVYGFARARQVIWLGFLCNLLAVLTIFISGMLPAAPFWPAENQKAWEAILGFSPRLLVASFIAYLCGEFLNSFVLAKLKVRTKGRFLWLRTIGSTFVGGGVDSIVFITVAFYGIIPLKGIQEAILAQWFLKVAYEILITPLTYKIVRFLKQREGVDALDTETDFTPFTLRV